MEAFVVVGAPVRMAVCLRERQHMVGISLSPFFLEQRNKSKALEAQI